MSAKRQQTMAKLARERKLQEKRELKREKKLTSAADRAAEREGEFVTPPPEDAPPAV
jgi:hypothetical protein